jgi:hypothetical protein
MLNYFGSSQNVIPSTKVSYVIVRRLPTQDSVTWVNTLWNQVTAMTPP